MLLCECNGQEHKLRFRLRNARRAAPLQDSACSELRPLRHGNLTPGVGRPPAVINGKTNALRCGWAGPEGGLIASGLLSVCSCSGAPARSSEVTALKKATTATSVAREQVRLMGGWGGDGPPLEQ